MELIQECVNISFSLISESRKPCSQALKLVSAYPDSGIDPRHQCRSCDLTSKPILTFDQNTTWVIIITHIFSASKEQFLGTHNPIQAVNPHNHSHGGTHLASIQCAISRNKKEDTVEKELRKSLPESTKLVGAKNKHVGKAIEGTQWEVFKPCMKEMNAWMFVHSEEILAALKPYRNIQKQQNLEENDFTGAIFEGRFYAPQGFKATETMPTRAEIYAKILGSLQSPVIGLINTLQAPARDLVFTLKAYVQKLEEESGNASNSWRLLM